MELPQKAILADPPKRSGGSAAKIYRVGTLTYTVRGVAVLLLWLLWGDFAFCLFESVLGRFFSIYLKDLHASNALIGVMSGTFPGLANLFFLPGISQWSDRTRSRFGRRIPFLYVTAPLTVLSLLAIGFAPEIAAWLFPHGFGRFSATRFTLVLLCFFVASYHLWNMMLVSSYNWLLRDVVPEVLMARFLSWFRIVSMGSSFLFLWFLFPVTASHRHAVFLCVALFYLAAFMAMCLNVKEGVHPLAPTPEERPGLLKSYAFYFRECLALPIYRNFFIVYVLTILGINCTDLFFSLFARDVLRLDMGEMGKVFACGYAVSAVIYVPMGWLCDRFSSLRVILGALIGFVTVAALACFLVHNRQTLLVYTVAIAIPSVGWALGWMTTGMKLFPEKKFGQFFSALNVFGCGSLIVGPYLFGKGMDLFHSDYRMAFLGSAVLYAAAIYPMALVYRDWKRCGGPVRYIPPVPPS